MEDFSIVKREELEKFLKQKLEPGYSVIQRSITNEDVDTLSTVSRITCVVDVVVPLDDTQWALISHDDIIKSLDGKGIKTHHDSVVSYLMGELIYLNETYALNKGVKVSDPELCGQKWIVNVDDNYNAVYVQIEGNPFGTVCYEGSGEASIAESTTDQVIIYENHYFKRFLFAGHRYSQVSMYLGSLNENGVTLSRTNDKELIGVIQGYVIEDKVFLAEQQVQTIDPTQAILFDELVVYENVVYKKLESAKDLIYANGMVKHAAEANDVFYGLVNDRCAPKYTVEQVGEMEKLFTLEMPSKMYDYVLGDLENPTTYVGEVWGEKQVCLPVDIERLVFCIENNRDYGDLVACNNQLYVILGTLDCFRFLFKGIHGGREIGFTTTKDISKTANVFKSMDDLLEYVKKYPQYRDFEHIKFIDHTGYFATVRYPYKVNEKVCLVNEPLDGSSIKDIPATIIRISPNKEQITLKYFGAFELDVPFDLLRKITD